MATPTLSPVGSVHARQAAALSPAVRAMHEAPAEAFLRGARGLLLLAGCLGLVGLVTALCAWAGPGFGFALLYLGPVSWAAWRGGFPLGVFVAVVATAAWDAADALCGAHHPAVGLLNGIIRFGLFVFASSLLSRLRLSILQEKLLARTDALTGAANGRTFYEEMYRAAEQGARAARPLTLAYLDLDNFKLLNDSRGHPAGDEALRHVAATIRKNIRAADVLARLGGDEFALLLPETDGEQAAGVLGRLHAALSEELAARGWPVTVSLGGATFERPGGDIDVMVGRADALMYLAKSNGKNRVEHRVVAAPAGAEADSAERVERRTAARVLCGRRARVLAGAGPEAGDELATVCDVSLTGVGLHMGRRLVPGTLVTVEPLLACGAKALLARVVWAATAAGGWSHGCTLSAPLNPTELEAWAREHPPGAPGAPPPAPRSA